MVYQLAVVQAQQVENVCLEVVDVDGLVDGVKADLVGRAHGLAGPDAVSGHPDCEGVDVVVAADRAFLLPGYLHLDHVNDCGPSLLALI